MNKTSTVPIFVGGALALMGFHAVIWIPYYIHTRFFVPLTASMGVGLALVIGIALLRGMDRAIFFAKIYLALKIAGGVTMLFLQAFHAAGTSSLSRWTAVTDLMTSIVLPGLLVWSGRRPLSPV